jgi:hypothetical protein
MKTGQINVIALVLFVSMMTFCKKKKESTPASSPTYNYSGSYSLYRYYQVSNNQALKTKVVPYISVSKHESGQNVSEPIDIGSAHLNSTKLNLIQDGFSTKTDGDTISRNLNPPYIWQVGGSFEYPAFTEVYNDSLPQFFKFNLLPDSLSRSGNTVIQLGGAHENGITVVIMSSATGGAWQGSGAAGTTTLAVSSPTVLATTTTGTLTVLYFNTYVKNIEGREIRFTHASNYDKIIKIIP